MNNTNVIENQVVQMEFDNKSFEKNVHVSINSIKELKDSLHFGSEASSSISRALDAINLSRITSGIDQLSNRFSTFGIAGMTVVQRITNALIDLGLTLERRVIGVALKGWNQIITGGTSRASNIEQATFQLQGLFGKETEGQVQLKMAMTGTAEEIKKLTGLTEDMIVADSAANYAVADTAYGLDSAAKAASQLAASGVDVIAYQEDLADSTGHMRTEMQVALRAISGTAAMTNSDYDSMAHIFATVAGNGRLMSEQLNSLGSRGLNAAATLANYFREVGIDANATEKSIREMVSKSQIDFMTFAKAMDSAYGEHAKDANSTFTGALSNMKFALSKIGADFIAPLREDLIPVLNNVRMAFNAVRASLGPFLSAFKNTSHFLTDKIIEKFSTLIGSGITDAEWKGTDQWNQAIANITNVVQIATDILEHFFNFVGSIVAPIRDAWKELFPSKGYSGFISVLERIRDFTASLMLSTDAMDKVRKSARGIFSVVNIAKQIITPIVNGIKELLVYFGILDHDFLQTTANIGDAIYELSESGKVGQKVNEIVTKAIASIKEIVSTFKSASDSLDTKKFSENLSAIIDSIKRFFSGMSQSGGFALGAKRVLEMFGSIIGYFVNVINQLSFKGAGNAAKVGNDIASLSTIALLYMGLVKILESMKNIGKINPDLFKQMMITIAVTAGSLLIVSSIDPDRLKMAALTIGALFFAVSMAFKFMSSSFMNLSQNVYKVSSDLNGFKGLLATFALNLNATFDNAIITSIKQMGIAMTVGSIGATIALLIAGVVNITRLFSDLHKELGYSTSDSMALIIFSVVTVFALIAALMKMYDKMVSHVEDVDSKSQIKVAVAITSIANLVRTLTKTAETFAKFKSFGEWLSAITGIASAIGSIFGLYFFMSKFPVKDADSQAKTLISIAVSIGIMMYSIASVAEIASASTNGLESVFAASGILIGVVSLLAVVIGILNKFPAEESTMKTLAAMGLIIVAIAGLGYTITKLAQFSWQQLLTALIPIGAVLLSLVAIAGIVHLVPGLDMGLFALAAAIAAIGVAVAGIGAGLYLGASAINLLIQAIIDLGAAWRDNGPNIIEGMTAVLSKIATLLPDFISEAITGFVDGIKENIEKITSLAPYISQFIGTVLVGVVQSISNNIGILVDALVGLIVNVINALANRMPDIFGAIENFLGPLFDGVIGLVAGLIASVAEGGGEILGRMIGGMVDGLSKALSKVSFTDFAKELCEFMLELQPFIDGLNGLDESSMHAAKMLAETITLLTADNIVRGLTSWFAGKSSLVDFGKDLAEFGPYIKEYSDTVKGIDVSAVEASTNAAQMIADFARTIPNEGGLVAKIFGENDIAEFGEKLNEFAPYIKQYAENVEGIDVAVVESSVRAAQMIADFARTIPNEGGLVAKITGDNDIETFGYQLKRFGKYIVDYAEDVEGLDDSAVTSSVNAALMLTEFADSIPNTGGLKAIFEGDNSVEKFGESLAAFGKAIYDYYLSIYGIDSDEMLTTTEALVGLFNVLKISDKLSSDSVSNMQAVLEAVAEIGLQGFFDAIAVDSAPDVKESIEKFFDTVKEGFKENSKSFNSLAYLEGLAFARKYADGIESDISVKQVEDAAKELGKKSATALGDAIGDPLEEPATELEPAGHSFDLGYENGIIEYRDRPITAADALGEDSVLALIGNNSTTSYDAGYDLVSQYRLGMKDASESKSRRLIAQHEGYYNPNANAKMSEYQQHEGYYSPNYGIILEKNAEASMDFTAATYGAGTAMFDYSRDAEEATEVTDDMIEAYNTLENESKKLTSDTNGVGSAASKASTSMSKLQKEVNNLIEEYENLWNSAKENANKDLFKGVDDQGDAFLSAVQSIMSQYENIYASAISRTNEQDLFAEVTDENESFAPETLLKNLEDQVDQINELNTIVGSLSQRITDENLREAISHMDVDQLPQLRAMYRMSAGELASYEKLYQDKVAANQEKIQNELTGDLSLLTGEYTNVASYIATDDSTNRLVANLQSQIDKLNEYNDTVASLLSRITDMNLREAITEMGVDDLDILKNLDRMNQTELDAYTAMYNEKIALEARSLSNKLSAELSAAMGMPLDISQFYEAYKAGIIKLDGLVSTDGSTLRVGQTAGNTIASGMASDTSKSTATTSGSALANSLADGIGDEDAKERAIANARLVLESILLVFDEAKTDFKERGGEIIHQLVNGIDELRRSDQAFGMFVRGVMEEAEKIMSNKINNFVRVGNNIVYGLQKGINDKASLVTKAAVDMVTDAVQKARAAADEHSPSRVFMEIGRFMDEGLAIGLRQYSGLAEDASTEMAENSISAVQEAINQLSGMLDGSIDVNPVITPTLDLSEVNARSQALAGMFNNRQIAVQARADEQQAEMMNQLGAILAEQNSEPKSIVFNQTNNSPKALSRTEIYRQTRNGFSQLANAIS